MKRSKIFLLGILLHSMQAFATTWDLPADISDPGTYANNPQAAVDPAGNTVAVWYGFDGTTFSIQGATLPFGGAWSAATTLSSSILKSYTPQVAVDSLGNTIAMWHSYDGISVSIAAAALPFGGSWSAPVFVSNIGENSFIPQLAIDAAGNAVAVWYGFLGNNSFIQAATLPFGGAWSAPIVISGAITVVQSPQAAVDPAGNALAVWTAFDGSNYRIQAATLPFGGAWPAPVYVSDPGLEATIPQIAVDSAGNAVAVWESFDGVNSVILSSSLPFGGAWTLPFMISISTIATDPQIAVDPAGNAVAVWYDFDGFDFGILAAALPFGGAWTGAVRISDPSESVFLPKVKVDPAGNAVAVWYYFDGSINSCQSASLPFGGAWTPPVTISTALEDSSNPQLTLNPTANGAAVWLHSTGSGVVIESATVGP